MWLWSDCYNHFLKNCFCPNFFQHRCGACERWPCHVSKWSRMGWRWCLCDWQSSASPVPTSTGLQGLLLPGVVPGAHPSHGWAPTKPVRMETIIINSSLGQTGAFLWSGQGPGIPALSRVALVMNYKSKLRSQWQAWLHFPGWDPHNRPFGTLSCIGTFLCFSLFGN